MGELQRRVLVRFSALLFDCARRLLRNFLQCPRDMGAMNQV
jgi:hypothetical protein